MIHRNRKSYIYIVLLLTLLVAACRKPEAKPPTNIEKDDKSTDDTDTVPKGKSGSGSAGETDTDGAKSGDGGTAKTGDESGDDGEDAAPAAYSFAFDEASYKVAFTSGGTYTRTVVETNKPEGDARDITYTSSETKIATVDDAGIVTFVTQGTVTITATKALKGEYAEATARYILHITVKPKGKVMLAHEIDRAMNAHGNTVNLNYIDTSAITDMSWLFSNDRTRSYGLSALNVDISEWDVSEVTNMEAMFWGATAFNQDISEWNVAKVTNMFSMFKDATAFNQDISKWDVSKVTNMTHMFNDATMFKQNLDAWAERINPAVKAAGWGKKQPPCLQTAVSQVLSLHGVRLNQIARVNNKGRVVTEGNLTPKYLQEVSL